MKENFRFDPEYVNVNHGEYLNRHTEAKCLPRGCRRFLWISSSMTGARLYLTRLKPFPELYM